MSQIPRRTSEFQASSVIKSANTRPSRIGLSTAGSSSALRPGHARPSATPSIARMTPSRTPSRSVSKDRNTMLPMTGEKEKAPVDDRAFIHGKTQQVLDELAKVGGFTELVQKGLKTMTLKQFIAIIQHFMKPIDGSIVLDGTNYVDIVHNFMTSMDYPYSINKSSLKTPSAPHCQNNIILLLAWFSEFSVSESEIDQLVDFTPTEDFSTANASKLFMDKIAEAFVLWNNQQEADSVTDQIRQANIESKIGSGVDLETEVSRLKDSIDALKKEANPVSLQKEYSEKRDETKLLSKRADDLEKEIDSLSSKAANIRANLKAKQAAAVNTSLKLNKLYKKLAQQKMTIEKRSHLLMEITQAKSVLASKKQAAMELEETCSENEIQLSKLIQKKFQFIDKLNNLIYKLYSELEIAGMREKFDPTAYEIKTTKINDAEGLNAEIEHFSRGLADLNEKFVNAMSAVNTDVSMYDAKQHQLKLEQTMLRTKLEKLTVAFEQLCAKESALERELHNIIDNMEQVTQQNEIDIKQLSDGITRMDENVTKFQDENEHIVGELAAFKKSSLEQCKMLYEKRKQEVQDHRERLTTMKDLVAEFNKRQKPFPENVQSTIDDVMSQRETRQDAHN